ncbi:MAG: hypothetical protein ACJ762_10040 [Solirubrobacteraceae bacterium]
MRRTFAVLLLTPALALGACGGGDSDSDKIKDVIQDVAKNAATICDHGSEKLLSQFGGDEAGCKEQARAYPDSSSKAIDGDIDVKVDGDTATADFTDNDGKKQHVTFVKDGDEWLVDSTQALG